MSYSRVIPRDLFNESRLLKGWGQVSLLIHDEKAPAGITLCHDIERNPGFEIEQDESSGNLIISNLTLMFNNEPIRIESPLNSRSPYTLCFIGEMMGHEGPLFDDDGMWSEEFLSYCSVMKTVLVLRKCGL